MPHNTATNATPAGAIHIDAMLLGSRWVESVITYAFPQTSAAYNGGAPGYPADWHLQNFQPFTAAWQDHVRVLLAEVSSFTLLTFSEGDAETSSLRWGRFDDPNNLAYAYGPGSVESGGDQWFANNQNPNPVIGEGVSHIVRHELGHALGLSHPHDGMYGPMPLEFDSIEYSTMSYRLHTSYQNGDFSGWHYEQSFMLMDIAALQYLYGANFAFNATDTVYSFNPTTGAMIVNGVTGATPAYDVVFRTIWDGGGVDTYDFSAFADDQVVSLAPGAWSTFDSDMLAVTLQRMTPGGGSLQPIYAAGNVANAFLYQGDTRSLIENVTTGGGNDLIAGNVGNNRIDGGGGIDTVTYQLATAGVTISLALTTAQATASEGVDTLLNIENLIGSALADSFTGSSAANVLYGMEGDDVLDGGAGADRLFGGDGNDQIYFDAADNLANVQGGAGFDILVFTAGLAPTSFNLVTQGFEAAEGRFADSGNTEAWTTRTLRYDSLWRLDRETLANDNGARTVLDYDEQSNQAWSLYWMQFDALDRADLEVLTYDDGSRVNLDYDQASAHAWTTLWSQYDASNNLVAEANDYDDGSRITLAHDVVDAFDWSENWVSYDALDRVDAEAIDYDDGSRITQNYDQDNSQAWTTDWVRYDALDRVDVQVITYDDGTYAVQDFDQADEHSWQSQWWLYDSNDNLIAFQGVNDDGSPFG